MSRVLIVRHAKAGKRGEWREEDWKRPLSAAGRVQAQGLVAALGSEAITHVLSSPHVRCRETVEPLARACGLRVQPVPELAEGSAIEGVIELAIRRPDAVMCTHGDIVAGLVDELEAQGVRLPDGPRWEKGSTWAIEVDGGRLAAGTYIPPPPS